MEPYIYKRNNEGVHIINLAKAWEKLMIAARIIAAIPNPKDVLVRLKFILKSCLTRPLAVGPYLMDLMVGLPLIDCFQQRVRTKSSS